MKQIPSYLPHDFLSQMFSLVQEAGAKILELYFAAGQDIQYQYKPDHSPLTAADLISHKLLTSGLKKLTPDIPVISEESDEESLRERNSWPRLWLVDPLDGTREFLARTDDFTVNIALVENHQPVFGLIYWPIGKTIYYALREGDAVKINCAEKNKTPQILSRAKKHECPKKPDSVCIIASRRHASNQPLQNFFSKIQNYRRISRGSALKFCLVAEGVADVYPRFGPTSEWDTAAGQCILQAAGGQVIDLHGRPLTYNKPDSLLNPDFLAVRDYLPYWQEFLKFNF